MDIVDAYWFIGGFVVGWLIWNLLMKGEKRGKK